MTDLIRSLVVCTGNICRSPMAEGFLASMVREQGLPHVVVESAGTHAPEGSPPSAHAVEAAAGLGSDIRGHRASRLDRDRVEAADLILVMEQAHLDFIRLAWPEESGEKVKMLRSFHPDSPSREEVPDPIGCTQAVYRRVARLLFECCGGVLRRLPS